MIEVSLSFVAWLCVLLVQALVHLKLIHLRRLRGNEADEPLMSEREILDASASSEVTSWPGTGTSAGDGDATQIEDEIRRSILARSEESNLNQNTNNPAMDDVDDDLDLMNFEFEDDDDFDDDDEPPNLKQRLSQTGSEMMQSCKSLESMVQEQILAPQILAQ